MNALISFAMFLETAGPGEAAESMKRRFGLPAVEAARDRWSGRLTGPWVTLQEVTGELGPPARQDASTLGYELATRTGYLYTFSFDTTSGRLEWRGFRRVGAIPVPHGELSDPMRIPQQLAEIGATTEEVRARLGSPAQTYGWWPVETWEYSCGLVLQLRHGVVEIS